MFVLQGGGRGLNLAAANAMWKIIKTPQDADEADIMLVFFNSERAGSYAFGPRPVEDDVTRAQNYASLLQAAFLNF